MVPAKSSSSQQKTDRQEQLLELSAAALCMMHLQGEA